jgi:hypothetical protein
MTADRLPRSLAHDDQLGVHSGGKGQYVGNRQRQPQAVLRWN